MMHDRKDYSAAEDIEVGTPLQMEVRGKLFDGFEIALVATADGNNETAGNAILDRMRRMFERQRTVFEYREAVADLLNKRVMLRELPTMIADYTDKRRRERAAQEARWQLNWSRNRRGEFAANNNQVRWLDQFNEETEKKLAEFKQMADDYPGQIKNLQERIDRCKRVLAGIEKTDLLLDLMPEDEASEAAE